MLTKNQIIVVVQTFNSASVISFWIVKSWRRKNDIAKLNSKFTV